MEWKSTVRPFYIFCDFCRDISVLSFASKPICSTFPVTKFQKKIVCMLTFVWTKSHHFMCKTKLKNSHHTQTEAFLVVHEVPMLLTLVINLGHRAYCQKFLLFSINPNFLHALLLHVAILNSHASFTALTCAVNGRWISATYVT